MLNNKNIVVGVCGGIAAYKVVDLVSRLRKLGADIQVIMTKNACQFVTPLTFRSLSNNPVITDMWEEPKDWDVQHISVANRADLFIVAPATANVIGKIATGIADDMLSTTIMATKAPVFFVPAMNTNMYENPITQQNISKLQALGYKFMEPGVGTMAERGVYGKGRLPEPPQIVDEVTKLFFGEQDFKGKRLLVTAGPTREAIDPVRYISNHSSGKMGYAVAKAAAVRGAEVTLVSGPVSIKPPEGVKIINVNSAVEMRNAVIDNFENNDAFLLVAAVADFRVQEQSTQKIKKKSDTLELTLVKNPDIAEEVGRIKGNKKLVGFCAETENLVENAMGKVLRKNMDFIVANDVTMEGAGFGTDTNIVKFIGKNGIIEDLPKISKDEVADKILDTLKNLS
jgi:phosphopantothenoylcysteine decarboxylase/phosphopantothenate--cysteine ligase